MLFDIGGCLDAIGNADAATFSLVFYCYHTDHLGSHNIKNMFTWIKFCIAANNALKFVSNEDSELVSILESQQQPAENADQYGAPRPMSALVRQHPEPEKYKQIMLVRRDSSLRFKELDALDYCNKALEFIDANAPFSEKNPLIIVSIRTSCFAYQFLYAPKFERACVLILEEISD